MTDAGRDAALGELMPLVYEDLPDIARRQLKRRVRRLYNPARWLTRPISGSCRRAESNVKTAAASTHSARR
jgi:hypothetical protein